MSDDFECTGRSEALDRGKSTNTAQATRDRRCATLLPELGSELGSEHENMAR